MPPLRLPIARRHFLASTVAGSVGLLIPMSSAHAATTPAPPVVPTLTEAGTVTEAPAMAQSPVIGATAAVAELGDGRHVHSAIQISCDRRRTRRSEAPHQSDQMARSRNREGRHPGRAVGNDAQACRLLGERARLASGRSANLLLSELCHQHRRSRHPLHPCEVETPERASRDRHPRLARIDHRAAQDHWAANESNEIWRDCQRCLRRRHPVASGIRLLRATEGGRLGRAAHCAGVGDIDESPRLHSLRCAGRRLG